MRKFSKIILLFISVLIALAVGELFLGVYYYKDNSTFYFFPPKLYKVFTPIENTFPGVSGSARFITNSMGIRADELLEDHTYRILAIGGSTTENVYLDQEETWTYLLQYILNKSQSKHSVWVGNAGKSGRTSRHHLVAMRHLPLKFWKIDAIVVLMGVNDFSKRLAEDVNYDPDFLEKRDSEEQLLSETFINSRFKKPFYRKMRLWELKNRVKQSFSQNIQDDRGNIFIKWRRHRKNSISIREDLPDMSHAIEEYKKNINLMIDIAEKNAFRLIFLTQPTLWRADLPEGLKDLLWLGGIGNYQEEAGKPYYSIEALIQGMEQYNSALLEICGERKIECIDLASFLSGDAAVFTDDVHFTEKGAQKVAEILSEHMLRSEPLKKMLLK